MTYIPESQTPTLFDVSYDNKIPQRELTDFVVARGDDKLSICALDDATSHQQPVVARGTLLADNGRDTIKVISAPLKEWCIEYAQTPYLWVRTSDVWYRLLKPAKEYARTHETARRRFELCSRIFILGTTMNPSECTYKLFVQLLSGTYGKMKAYSEKELLLEKDFILAQIKNLRNESLSDIPFVRELREKKPLNGKRTATTSKKKDPSSSNGSISVSTNGNSEVKHWTPSAKLDKDGKAKLFKRLDKIVLQITKHKYAFPFLEPVDPVREQCPDYLVRVKKPMDYGTIRKRLEKGAYDSLDDVAADVRQIKINCCQYNGEDHQFSRWAIELSNKFEVMAANAEDAELASMNKRLSKKRKASDALPPTGKQKKNGKAAKKTVKSSPDPSVTGSPSKDDVSTGSKLCARSESQSCERIQLAGSKYCSDECGLIVARQRIEELNKAGFSVDDYIKQHVTKALVHSRS
ncbi:Transcription factor GTE10 [Gracilariopsis chorda]|uniref:Transcription factor GTE10 n=1 Tax=Gracilariopsis chorda TaxID=448386 RepID=A0A2V3IL21_9FLOR|nr:Transcription factor GTE10 [Gracilariopsis chorda]|eukprot:PXF42781.1 Transcription factor GTE10 [Gracilariopsis chorda]